VPGTLVCNIGDCLKFWTNGARSCLSRAAASTACTGSRTGTLNIPDCTAAGLYQSTPHRVINLDPARTRVSAPFFYEPEFEAVVQPIDTLRGNRRVLLPHLALLCREFALGLFQQDITLFTAAQECTVRIHHVWPASGKQGPEQLRAVVACQCMCKFGMTAPCGHGVQGARPMVCCCCYEWTVRSALLLQKDARDSISPGVEAAEGKRGRNS